MNQDSEALHYLPQEQRPGFSALRAHNSNKLEVSVDKGIKVQFKQTQTEKLGDASLEENS